MNLYKINYITETEFGEDEVISLGALDALEEWFFENEGKTDEIKKLTVEFVRRVS